MKVVFLDNDNIAYNNKGIKALIMHRPSIWSYYVGTVNGPTSITRLGVWKMYQKVASFSFLDPPKTDTNNFLGV